MTQRYGHRAITRTALLILAVAFAGLCVAIQPISGDLLGSALLWPYLLAGLGLANPPIATAVLAAAPRGMQAAASAAVSTARQVGMDLGIAVTGVVILASLTPPEPTAPASTAQIFVHGLTVGYGVTAALCLTAAGIATPLRTTRSDDLVVHDMQLPGP